MDIPGVADAMQDPELRAKAEQTADRLLDELKKSVKVSTRDVGVLRKELHVTVPARVISDFLGHNFDEIIHDAVVPGFRRGRAPRRLIEKRFGGEVRDSLKTMVLGQSYFAALENEKLDVIGDPLVQVTTDTAQRYVSPDEALEHLTLPDDADFEYTCEVEIRPTFEIPELEGIEITRPVVTIADEDVDAYILNQRKIRGRFEPVDDGAVPDDMLVADVTLKCGDETVKTEDNVQVGVRPQRLDGITLENLGDVLKGAKAGDARTVACTISEDYERRDLRGKAAEFSLAVHEVKRLEPISEAQFLESTGYTAAADLRKDVRADMEVELDRTLETGLKNQILDYLLEKTPMELPEKLSARQADRAILRQVLELQRRGVPFPDIEARIDELRTVAQKDAAVQLKLQFILDKVAQKLEVTVTDEEINSAIAQIARRYNRRFDRVRDDLRTQGTLSALAEQIVCDKCLDQLLKSAKIVDKPVEEPAPKKSGGRKKKS